MKLFVPERFNVLRILREDADSKTFVGSDNVLKRNDIVVKLIRKRHLNPDFPSLLSQLSWYSGIRHQTVGIMFDIGSTPRGDFYCVREYLPTSELVSVNK